MRRNTKRNKPRRKRAKARSDVPDQNFRKLTAIDWSVGSRRPQPTPRPMRPLRDAMYSTRQLVENYTVENGFNNNNFITATGAVTTGSFGFTLADLDQVSQLIALFDQYRIDMVEVFIRPSIGGYSAPAAGADLPPEFVVVADFDNLTVPTGLAYVRQYDNARDVAPYEGLYLKFRPILTMAAYSGGAFSGYSTQGDVWLDAANTTVQHYGIKWALGAWAGSGIISWRVETYYYVSFKSTI